MLVAAVAAEFRASRQLVQLQTDWQQQGLPIDNRTIARMHRQHSDASRAAAWQSVCDAAVELNTALPVRDGDDLLSELIQPDAAAPDSTAEPNSAAETAADGFSNAEPIAAMLGPFAEQAAPWVRALQDVLKTPGPITVPRMYIGVGTRLDDLQQRLPVSWCLQACVAAAVQDGDTQRLIELLELMGRLPDSIDDQSFYSGELLRMALRSDRDRLIRNLVSYDGWTADELAAVRGQLAGDREVAQRWRLAAEAELVAFIPSLNERRRFGGDAGARMLAAMPPSQQLAAWKGFVQQGELYDRPAAARYDLGNASLIAIPWAQMPRLASWQGLARHFEADQQSQIGTRCAVAIKEYRLRFGHWPERLDQLAELGLTAADWTIGPAIPLGYRVAEDQSSVLLWTADLSTNPLAAASGPPPGKESNSVADWVVRIH